MPSPSRSFNHARGTFPLFVAVTLTAFGCSGRQNAGKADELAKATSLAKPTSLARRAHAAKAAGATTIRIASEPMPSGVNTIDQVSATYSVLVAQPLTRITVSNGDNLVTWYKLKVASRLLIQKSVSEDPLPADIPQALTPLKNGEILVPLIGGDMLTEDVEITEPNPYHFAFQAGSSYVLIVFLENRGQLAELAADSGSVYVKNGDFMTPLSDLPSRLAKELQNRYQNSLPLLQSELARRGSR